MKFKKLLKMKLKREENTYSILNPGETLKDFLKSLGYQKRDIKKKSLDEINAILEVTGVKQIKENELC